MSDTKKSKAIIFKRILYTICAYALCIIAYFRGAGTGPQWHTAIWCIGFAILPIILCQYKAKEYLKVIYPYAIWLVVFTIGAIIYIPSHGPNDDYRLSFICQIMEVGVCGILIIRDVHTVISRGIKKTLGNVSVFTIAAFVLFLLCTISVNESVWPLYFGVLFISLYLTPFSRSDLENLGLGLADALIIMFFVIQSHAFLYRPYDEVRYLGFFNNANVNAMFYIVCYIALLTKYAAVRKTGKQKWLTVVTFLFAAAMWGFVMLTMSRIVILAFVTTTVVFLIITECIMFKTRVKGFLLRGLAMFGIFVVSLPLVYACVRYIPALRHHPIWLGDYSEDKVHSYDPWNSEKYIDIEDLLGGVLERINEVKVHAAEKPDEALFSNGQMSGVGDITPVVNCQIEDNLIVSYEDGVTPGTDCYHPLYQWDLKNGDRSYLGVRKYVYDYFLPGLNMAGHVPEYPSFWCFSNYMVPHAHNSYLQIAYAYGIPAGIMMILINVGAIIYMFISCIKKGKKTDALDIMSICVQVAFMTISLMETLIFPGKMLLTLFFISLLPIAKRKIDAK